MQRIPRRIFKTYPSVRLYLNDVQDIYDLMSQHCEKVTIEAEGYIIPDLDKLKDFGARTISRLELVGRKGDTKLAVSLDKSRASTWLNRDDDTLLYGLLTRIDSVLTRHAPIVRFLASKSTAGIILVFLVLFNCVGLAISIPTLVNHLSSGHPLTWSFDGLLTPQEWLGNMYLGLNFGYAIWFGWHHFRRRSVIYLEPWNHHTTFWQRNREEILRQVIVGVIVAVIFSTLSFFAGYLLGAQH